MELVAELKYEQNPHCTGTMPAVWVLFGLGRVLVPAADNAVAISKNMVIHDSDQPRFVQMIHDFKQAVPFTGRQLANIIVDFLWGRIQREMNAAMADVMIIGSLIGSLIRSQIGSIARLQCATPL